MMKIITLSLAFMAWIRYTRTYELPGHPVVPSPQTTGVHRYTQIMRHVISGSLHPTDPNRHDHPHFEIMNRDKINIYKVIDGRFVPFDGVKGFLTRIPLENYNRVLGHPPILEYQYGEVEVRLGIQNFLFHAALMHMLDYQDHGVASGRTKYFCTIERDSIIFLAGILVNSQQLHVPDNVERVLFVNNRYRNPGDILYQGQLFEATPVRIQELFDSL